MDRHAAFTIVFATLTACGKVQATPDDAPIDIDSSTPPIDANLCGNGTRTDPEECDDGNNDDGDGCSAACLRDPPGSLTFYIAGRVTTFDDMNNVFGGTIGVGTQFTGRYTYDPSTTDTNTDITVGDYQHAATGYGMTVNMGTSTFQTNPANVDFLFEIVDRTTDAMVMISRNNVSLPNVTGIANMSWQLDGMAGGGPFAGDALITQCPNILAFTQPFGLTITGNIGGTMWFIRSTVESCMQ
jgi:cysteine-rich repeat protein